MITVFTSINVERENKISDQLKKAGLDFHVLKGVLVKKNDIVYGHVVEKAGNVGCMLSKLAAWKYVSLQNEPCNLLEDDELIPEDYLLKRTQLLSEIKADFDFIFLNVLRPCGVAYSTNFLKISKKQCNKKYKKCCNVWNSNYILTPRFASVLLNVFDKHRLFKHVFNKIASDKVLSNILTDLCDDYNFFTIIKSNLLTKHFEEDSLRKESNN